MLISDNLVIFRFPLFAAFLDPGPIIVFLCKGLTALLKDLTLAVRYTILVVIDVDANVDFVDDIADDLSCGREK